MAALPLIGSSVQTGHIGFGPGFIKKNQPAWRDFCLELAPLLTLMSYVLAFLFAGPQRFF